MDQIKTFVRCFNDAVKEKVVFPEKAEVSPDLIDRLRDACHLDDVQNGKQDKAQIFTSYNAAEGFWLEEFADAPASSVESLRDHMESPSSEWSAVSCEISNVILDAAQAKCGAEMSVVILAAFGVLCSRLSGRQAVAVVTSLGGEDTAIPLKILLPWDRGFREIIRGVEQKVRESRKHALFAFNVLANPLRMAAKGLSCPVFDVGFAYSESDSGKVTGIRDALSYQSIVREGMGLALNANRDSRGAQVNLEYSKAWFVEDTVKKLSSYLKSILIEITENPDIGVGTIALDGKARERHLAAPSDDGEAFNF